MSEDKIAATSRYAGVETGELVAADGRRITYLRRRFVPRQPGVPVGVHAVAEGDRPDTVAAATLNDPEQYWRLADANGVLHPAELTEEIGRILSVAISGSDDV